MSTIIPIEDFKNLCSQPSITESTDDVKISHLINFCWGLITSYTNCDFSFREQQEEYIYGNGEPNLELPQRVIKVYDISDVNGKVHALSALRFSKDRHKIISNEIFRLGDLNIKVIADWGWEEIPQDVISSLVALCEGNFDLLDNVDDKLSNANGPYESESIGNYKYVVKQKYNTITGDEIDSTGNALVDQILSKYIKRISIGVI